MQNASNRGIKLTLYFLTLVMFFKIAGYFTISESVAITRVIKIILRVSMTGLTLMAYKIFNNNGLIPSFKYKNTLSSLFYIIYLLIGISSLIWSSGVPYSMLQLAMNIETFVFAYFYMQLVVVLQHYWGKEKIRLGYIIGVSIFYMQLIFLIGMIVNPDKFFRLTHGGDVARLGGYMMNPNELGMLAVIGISMCMLEINYLRNLFFSIVMLLICMIALVQTGSRSSMIGFMLVLFYFITRSKSIGLKIATYAGMVVAIPIIINVIFLKMGNVDEVLSMTGRLPFWKALLGIAFPKEPLLGYGYMRIYYTDYFSSIHTYAAKMTHNTFVQVIMNLGIIGFSTVVLQMIATLRGFFRSKNRELKGLFLGIFTPIFINSLTEFGIFGEANFGILFYQLIIFIIVIRYNPNLSRTEKMLQENRKTIS